jgi:hypothetical protein
MKIMHKSVKWFTEKAKLMTIFIAQNYFAETFPQKMKSGFYQSLPVVKCSQLLSCDVPTLKRHSEENVEFFIRIFAVFL